MLWRTRSVLQGVAPTAEYRLLPAVLLLSGAWLIAARANLLVVHAMLWPLLAFSAVWAGAGWSVARRFAFPLAFLYFAIPFWDYFEPTLQAIASNVVGFLVKLAGTQATVNGPYILLPTATIFIALTCSGAHFLAISLAMGTLAGEVRQDGLRMRLLIIAFAGLLSIAFNSVRILLIVLAYLHPGLREGFETIGHITFGWWVFALDLVVFFVVLWVIPSSTDVYSANRTFAETRSPMASHEGLAWALSAALVLPVTSAAARAFDDYPSIPAQPPATTYLTGPISPDARWHPTFAGAAWEHRVAYITGKGRVVELYANMFHRQSQDNELVASGKDLFDEETFKIGVRERLDIALPKSKKNVNVNKVDLRDASGRHWLALYTYVADKQPIASARGVQMLTAWRALYGRPSAGVLAVATPCISDCAAIEADLRLLMAHALSTYSLPGSTP